LSITLGRVCKLTMDPRHSSIWLFRKAASELLCKHALVLGLIHGLESGSFRAIHWPEAPNCETVWRLGQVQAKGECLLRELNRIELGID
jgi:hypothetical protein